MFIGNDNDNERQLERLSERYSDRLHGCDDVLDG